MRPTQDLVNEHNAVLIMLQVMDSFAQKAADEKTLNTEHLDKIIEFLQVFVDKCHHGKEEKELLPVLLAVGNAKDKIMVDLTLKEHEEGRNFVRGIKGNLDLYKLGNQQALDGIITNIKNFNRLLKEHIRKENTILFPRADEIISEEKQIEMEKAFTGIEKEVIGEGVHEQFHQLLEVLKKEYQV